MIGIGVVPLILGIIGTSWGQEDRKEEKVRELLRLSRGALLGPMAIMQVAKEGMPEGDEREEMEDLFVPIYADHFTEEEIDEWIAFYQSPLGRKISELQPTLIEETKDAAYTWIAMTSGARKLRNEVEAVNALREVASAQMKFRQEDGDKDGVLDYATSLEELRLAGLIDNILGSGIKSGYSFGLSGSTFDWLSTATPVTSALGDRNFIVCTDGCVRFSFEKPASCSSARIQ
jgi:hypothetical protein